MSRLPILVQPYVTTSGRPGWRWTCRAHRRHRGHHQFDRFTDWVRERNNCEPDDHPFVRAMRGASQHWHKHHAPEHHCCLSKHRDKEDREKVVADSNFVTCPRCMTPQHKDSLDNHMRWDAEQGKYVPCK